MNYSKAIRTVRAARGISQKELASLKILMPVIFRELKAVEESRHLKYLKLSQRHKDTGLSFYHFLLQNKKICRDFLKKNKKHCN